VYLLKIRNENDLDYILCLSPYDKLSGGFLKSLANRCTKYAVIQSQLRL